MCKGAEQIRIEILQMIKQYFSMKQKWEPTGAYRIPFNIPSYSWEEVCETLDLLLSGQVTMGQKVRQFEEMFANYIGVKHAVMVNSGSSANLVALSILSHPDLEQRICPGDEIIVPAIPWSTTVFPILQIGAIPVFVDVDLESYNINFSFFAP